MKLLSLPDFKCMFMTQKSFLSILVGLGLDLDPW